MKKPFGIDVSNPSFGWKIKGDCNGLFQTAYEIIVDGMWESGKVESDNSTFVIYDGKPLEPCTEYQFRVRVWDNYGNVSNFETSSFETGLMTHKNWRAKFITVPGENTSVPVFTKSFKTNGEILRARMYSTAHGVYEAFLNGEKIGDHILSPGMTSYNKHLMYQTYDITNLLKSENTIEVSVGDGWCVGRFGFQCKEKIYRKKSAFLGQIVIEYKDGTTDFVVTDSDWGYYYGKVKSGGIYDGEIYDNRIDRPDKFDKVAIVDDFPLDVISAQENEPVRICERIKPVSMFTSPSGEKVIDFGVNLVGFVSFRIKAEKGSRIIYIHGEVLDSDGNFYSDNMRTATNRIEYTFSGEGVEEYRPLHTFQGFRYVKLIEYPENISEDCFEALVIHSDIERTGYFECSDELVNKLFENIIRGQLGNYVDVPTDCPQRDERQGWTGDTQVFARTGAKNTMALNFFKKWLHDMRVDANDDGSIPVTIPDDVDDIPPSSAWGDAAVVCPWEMYMAYADKRILSENYEMMKGWVEYIRNQGDNEYLWNTGIQYGDWVAIDAEEGSYTGKTDPYYIATSYYAYCAKTLSDIAYILKKDEDGQFYMSLREKIEKEFVKEYTKDGEITQDTQTALALALAFKLAPDMQSTADRLAEKIKKNSGCLDTGFVGTPILCRALSENGYGELAYTLLLQKKYPSWLFSVLQGATTIWEHWDGIKEDGTFWSKDMNSFNHYAYGAVGAWMYETVCGIRYVKDAPGYREIEFNPIIDSRLSWAKASIETLYGRVSSSWERENGRIKLKFTVPANTKAHYKEHTLLSGEYEFII